MTSSIFVYGTLKPGLRYRYLAEQGGTFSEEEAWLTGCDLYHLSPENYPALVRGEGRIHGWRYTYNDVGAALQVLDRLEGLHIEPPEYERIEAVSQPGDGMVWVYLYLNRERLASAELVRSGVWTPESSASVLPQSLKRL